jgi:hypothetical protein
MTGLFKNRITILWLLLMAATALSWESVRAFDIRGDFRYATTGVLIVAFVKVRFVGLDFMELRHAPLPLRIAFELWCVAVCALLIVLYWLGNG